MHKINGSRAYFRRIDDSFKLPETKEDLLDLDILVETLKHGCLELTKIVASRIKEKIGEGLDPKAVMNYHLGTQLWDLGKLHAGLSIVMNAIQGQKSLGFSSLRTVYKVVT